MTLMEHLTELRTRIVRSVLAVTLGAVVGWIAYPAILDVLLAPYCDLNEGSRAVVGGASECLLYVRDPVEPLQIRMQISLYAGLALAMPVVLWQIWKFVTPGLYPHERRYAVPFVVSAVSLFAMGAGLAYWTMPKALGFFEAIGGDDLVGLYSPAPYLRLITFMMLAFGIGFEFPILLVFLQMAGIVQPSTLARYRRHALVGIVVGVAVITPSGDPISLVALSAPMYLFFELAVLWGKRRVRRTALASG
jgi:sec-independent protein translocase protein TatC